MNKIRDKISNTLQSSFEDNVFDDQLAVDLLEESFKKNSVLFSLFLRERKIEKQKQLTHLLNDETEELLDTLDNYSVKRYATYNFDLIDEDDCEECDDCVALEDYDDDEILYECDRRDLSLHVGGKIDIITESQLEEMTDLFLSADFNKRNEILKQLK